MLFRSSVALSGFLMVMANHLVRRGNQAYRRIRWILLAMLSCAIAFAFIVIPWMNALREQALFAGLTIYESSQWALFNRLHTLSSFLFVLQSVLGIFLVWQATKNAD